MQFKGQASIIYQAVPIEDVLMDPSLNDSIKNKLELIASIRRFAIDSLGLKDSKNYTTYYDQKGKPVLWVLTASDTYKLKAYQWNFPVVGEVSYKGFFIEQKGLLEDSLLRMEGYDTDYGPVSAWSTLGWFRDPILSGMLKRSEGQLAELIIHEMTHSTLYVKSDVNFNENLASAVGEAGAVHFLNFYFGKESKELNGYLQRKEDSDLFTIHMLNAAKILDTLYTRIEGLEADLKYQFKYDRIQEIVNAIDTIQFHVPGRYQSMFKKQLPNNAYFLSFVRYDAQKSEMRNELKNVYHDNIAKYLAAIKQRYE